MQTLSKDRTLERAIRGLRWTTPGSGRRKILVVLLLTGTMLLSACGGGSGPSAQKTTSLSGNWQYTVASPPDGSFLGGLQGGFLLEKNGSITGSAVYSVSLPGESGAPPVVCNSGTAPITVSASGPNVTLTAVAGPQTFTLTGTLSSDGTTMAGTYASTAGTAADGSACGTAQTGLPWSATLVPPLNGFIRGNFHSTGGPAGLNNQDFLLSGTLAQGENIGASSATVTGTLSFVDPASLLSVYPCFNTAGINGEISGNSVILQIIGNDGSNLGQIGGVHGSGLNSVTFDSTTKGYVLHSAATPSYAVNSKPCLGASISNAGDTGNICVALGSSSTACQQPISLSPATLIFPNQRLGSAATTRTVTLTNNSSSSIDGMALNFSLPANGGFFYGSLSYSDFNGVPNFQAQDTCVPGGETLLPSSTGAPFSLTPGQSCKITIGFSPQESCPWFPFGNPPSLQGSSPQWCPLPLTATLSVSSPISVDNNTTFAVPMTGYGISAVQPSTPELDFGAQAVSIPGPAQQLKFTNTGTSSVQIQGPLACTNPDNGQLTLPRNGAGAVGGVQVVSNGLGALANIGVSGDGASITYNCDSDTTTLQPNFQITSDTCSGALLPPEASCSLQVMYVPQTVNSGLDYFLELNTLQCTDTVTTNCELDSGRFPVELRANPPSPLRLSPAAGLDFGTLFVGDESLEQTITMTNDPADPNAGTVTLVGKILLKGNYTEVDNCPSTLAPGDSCTFTVTFKPKAIGYAPGSITINYTPEPTGGPQVIYLRGTGQ